MKIKLFISIIASAFIFFACDDEDVTDMYLPSAQIKQSVSEVTVFDVPFTNQFTVSNPGVQSFTITSAAGTRDITVSELSASSEFTAADFDRVEIGGEATYVTTIDYGTSKATQSFSIDVIEAMTATVDGTVAEYNSSKAYVSLAGETKFSDLGNVVVVRKIITSADPDAEFVEIVNENASTEFDYTDSIVGTDYNLNDTIIYRVIAHSGDKADTATVTIPVDAKPVPGSVSGMLSTSEDSISFIPEDSENETSAAGTLAFTSTSSERGFTSADVEFIPIDEMFGDFSELVSFVDMNSGANTVANVMVGDMFAFKFEDSTDVYYGVMTITTVELVAIGDAENKIEFSYAFDVKE